MEELVRFNMMMGENLKAYLCWAATVDGVSQAEYMRRLLKRDEEYQSMLLSRAAWEGEQEGTWEWLVTEDLEG